MNKFIAGLAVCGVVLTLLGLVWLVMAMSPTADATVWSAVEWITPYETDLRKESMDPHAAHKKDLR
ncbi:MAG: hypothetical protein ACT4QB_12020 [Gammaproteobacteria bacterium]